LLQDSNIFRKMIIDGSGRHDVSFVLVHARSCDAESRKQERMVASATVGYSAWRRSPATPLSGAAAVLLPGTGSMG